MKTRAPAPRRRQSGFALLITITLLAFLVLLVVSLATLTKVETKVASNNQQLSQARQNALMALNVALGRLQTTAGPDTRATGTADLISGRNIDKKNWTGVWNAAAAGADKNIAWLVSGTAPAGSAGVTGVLSAANGNSLVELVGAGSTDIANQAVTGNRVQVETQPITSASVPGMTGPQTIGNFAYWVGDEGVKAKVSLTNPWAYPSSDLLTATSATTDQTKVYRFLNAQRFGIEGVADSTGTALGAAYPATSSTAAVREAFNSGLPSILSLGQLPLANAPEQAALSDASRARFHDLTANSYGVLTDTANGGLKRDLTAWLADTTKPSNPVSANASDDYISAGDPADSSKYGLPKWELLRNYATPLATPAAPQQQTPTRQGVHPVITYARMAYNITHPGGAGVLRHNMMPVVVLWNPYNVPLKAGTYEICFRYTYFKYSNSTYTGGNFFKPGLFPGTIKSDYFNVSTLGLGGVDYSGGNTFWRFKLETGGIAAGESHVFTITTAQDNSPYSSTQSTLSDTDYDPSNCVFLPGTKAMTPANYAAGAFVNMEGSSSTSQDGHGRLEVMLTDYLGAGKSDQALRDASYHTIIGMVGYWGSFTKDLRPLPTDNTAGLIYFAHTIEATMSSTALNSNNQQSGTPRWLASQNPLAPVSLRYPRAASSTYSPSYSRDFYINSSSPTVTDRALPIPKPGTTTVSSGMNLADSSGQAVVLRELPSSATYLFSLGQLQHLTVSPLNLNPTYAIGNSLGNPYIDRDKTYVSPPSDYFCQAPNPYFPANTTFARLYDTSYLLNQALWDGYFFSTVPATLTDTDVKKTGYRLPNARHQFLWTDGIVTAAEVTDLKTATKAAAHLLVNGGFNINSTSEQAWRALLHKHNGVDLDPANADNLHAFSRFAAPPAAGQPNATWVGYRILSNDQINALAAAIVTEIRARGPFLSLSGFVNRSLAATNAGLKGTLQAAIDSTTGTGAINSSDPFFNPTTSSTVNPVTKYPVDITTSEQKLVYDGAGNVPATVQTPSQSRASFAPGYLTQADLLTAIGPALSARSDTFRIRAYGDTINPATGQASPESRAWCEAIVQRLPDYSDTSMPADTQLSAAPASPAKTTNDLLGRRFKIISFRWLSSHDI